MDLTLPKMHAPTQASISWDRNASSAVEASFTLEISACKELARKLLGHVPCSKPGAAPGPLPSSRRRWGRRPGRDWFVARAPQPHVAAVWSSVKQWMFSWKYMRCRPIWHGSRSSIEPFLQFRRHLGGSISFARHLSFWNVKAMEVTLLWWRQHRGFVSSNGICLKHCISKWSSRSILRGQSRFWRRCFCHSLSWRDLAVAAVQWFTSPTCQCHATNSCWLILSNLNLSPLLLVFPPSLSRTPAQLSLPYPAARNAIGSLQVFQADSVDSTPLVALAESRLHCYHPVASRPPKSYQLVAPRGVQNLIICIWLAYPIYMLHTCILTTHVLSSLCCVCINVRMYIYVHKHE